MEISYFLLITFFIRIYLGIKNNPIFLIEGKYPIVLSSTDNNYYYLIIEEKNLKIEKDSGKINETRDDIHSLSDSIYASDNLDKNFLVNNDNKCYYINYNPTISFEECSPCSSFFVDKTEFKKIGSIWNNDFIIYGFLQDKLSFVTSSNQFYMEIDISGKLSCGFMDGDYYICAGIINNEVNLICLEYKSSSLSLNSETILNYEDVTEISLYDTPKTNVKLLCFIESQSINCRFYHILSYLKNGTIEYEILGEQKINFSTLDDFSEKNCYFSECNYEFLFCCAIRESIYCYRINNDNFNVIKEYKLNIPGDNSYLTIKSNNDFITFFCMNKNEDKVNVYEYYIHFPKCQNKNYTILNSINFNKSENEKERLSNLFKVETNIIIILD